MASISVVGSGFSGLSAAAVLAQAGHEVTVFEKNEMAGGRARKFTEQGFAFDMGPSWYWMPDVFEKFYRRFGKSVSDFYELKRLDPSYRVFFSKDDVLDVPAGQDNVVEMFERLEKGSGSRLKKFLEEAEFKYKMGIGKFAYLPGVSITELLKVDLLKGIFNLNLFQSVSTLVRKHFRDRRLVQLLEFPMTFLGARPSKIPALYSLMNYADMRLGTWYPMGGMHKIVEAMVEIGRAQGVNFQFNSKVERMELNTTRIKSLLVNGQPIKCDYVVASADYHHVEQQLLPPSFENTRNIIGNSV